MTSDLNVMSLEDSTFHSERTVSGEFGEYAWACTTPERPRDDTTCYDWRCPKCIVAAEASLQSQGDEKFFPLDQDGVPDKSKRYLLSEMITAARLWLQENT